MVRTFSKILGLLFFGVVSISAYAAEGDRDLSYSGDGRKRVAFDLGGNGVDSGRDIAVDSQGRTVVVGLIQYGADSWGWGIARIRPDGELDSTFHGDGKVESGPGVSVHHAPRVAVHTDTDLPLTDLIVVAGGAGPFDADDSGAGYCTVSDSTISCATRDNLDGFNGWYNDVAIRGGKVYLGATWDRGSLARDILIERRQLATMSLDPTYGFIGTTTVAFDRESEAGRDELAAIAVTADHEVVFVGDSMGPSGNQDFFYAKLPSSGLVPTFAHFLAFDRGGMAFSDDYARAVALAADESFVVVGESEGPSDDNAAVLVRVSANGLAALPIFLRRRLIIQ